MKLLLDTCTFLWVMRDDKNLSARARDLFRAPEHDVFLSAVSAWEIATKQALGRLPLPTMRLPALHRDPFDRLLVCQAIVHGLTLLTPDPLISQYPARVVW